MLLACELTEQIRLPDERTLEFKTRIFKVISDTNRLKILEMLRDGELCQCEIVPVIDQSQPTVSRHLRLLEEAGLIRSRRDGVRMFYEVTDPHIYNVIDAIDAEAGDEVGVFVDDDCFGAYKVNTTGYYGALQVYGDDPLTPEKEGAVPGNLLTIKVWDSSKGIENTLSSDKYSGPSHLTWLLDGEVMQVDINAH